MAQTITSNQTDPLSGLHGIDLAPTRFTATGQEFLMGEMTGIVTALPLIDLMGMKVDEVVTRQDYELEGIEPGNRAISPAHVAKIKRGLRKHARKLLTGTFTLALAPAGVKIERLARVSDTVQQWIVRFSILSGYTTYIVDAQHRNQALAELWDEIVQALRDGVMEAEEVARLLGQSSVPVLLILEDDRDEISRMFVTMASTKPISPSLIAVMDREQFANRLGLEVARESELLGHADRLAYQTSGATKDNVYAAAAVRGAAANMFIGFRDRTPEMRESNLRSVFEDQGMDPDDDETVQVAATEVVDLLNYAYTRLPGWSEMAAGKITPKEFRAQYVHGTPSGLYVIAGVLAAARLSPGVDVKHVIDLLSDEISWRRDDRVPAPDTERLEHPNFEGSLVVTEPDIDDDRQIVGWRTKTAGGARTNYEKATRAVITRLMELDEDLAEMRSDPVQVAMGLKASGRRGRPRKA